MNHGVTKEERQAVKHDVQRAATPGNAVSRVLVGVMYEYGQGVTQDHVQAAAFYEEAARLGNTTGQINLARLLHEGRGVARNSVHAHAWLNLASTAEKPHPDAAEERDALARQLSHAQLAEARRLSRAWKQGAALGKSRVGIAAAS